MDHMVVMAPPGSMMDLFMVACDRVCVGQPSVNAFVKAFRLLLRIGPDLFARFMSSRVQFLARFTSGRAELLLGFAGSGADLLLPLRLMLAGKTRSDDRNRANDCHYSMP